MVMGTSNPPSQSGFRAKTHSHDSLPRGTPDGAGLCALDRETGAAQQLQTRLSVVVTPPHRRAPTLPVVLFALPRPERPNRQEASTRFHPTVDVAEKRGMPGAGQVDDGVEDHHRIEGLGREAQIRHVGFEESRRRDMPAGQLQLPRGDVHAGDGEALREPARYGYTRAAAEVEHGRVRWEFAGQFLQRRERRRVLGVLVGQVPFGNAVISGLDHPLEGVVHRAVIPPSTTMQAPTTEADSSEAR
jgi:hypothetical protein